jgi:hypothetical protein
LLPSGLTWSFALFATLFDAAVNESLAAVMHFLFCAFNSLQGFFIFLLLNLREKSVRKAWHRLLVGSRQSLVDAYRRMAESISAVGDSKRLAQPYSQDTRVTGDSELIQLRSNAFSSTVSDNAVEKQRNKHTTKDAVETTVGVADRV